MIAVLQIYATITAYTAVILAGLFLFNQQMVFWDIKVSAKPRTGKYLDEQDQQKADRINDFLSSIPCQIILMSILWPLAWATVISNVIGGNK